MRNAFLMAALLAVVAVAGCLDEDTPVAATDDGHDHMHGHSHEMFEHGEFTMHLRDCEEGGFVALYAKGEGETLAGVWVLADIREEVGNPIRDGLGGPITGPQKGNWHQGFRCQSASVGDMDATNFQMGWIGDMVEVPEWDPGGADVHFLISGLGLQTGPLRDELTKATTADVTNSLRAETVWYADQGVYTIYDDKEKGVYESYSLIEPLRTVEERTIRLWWTVPSDGGHSDLSSHGHDGDAVEHHGNWSVVYWDLHTNGGQQHVTPTLQSVEVACHTGTDGHGPQGGACQPTLTTVYDHGHITMMYGGLIPDVTLEDVWVH